MAVVSGEVYDLVGAACETVYLSMSTFSAEYTPRYMNRVWDTQVVGDDKHHFWKSSDAPDVNGVGYDGPGTWGVHTSKHCAFKL